MGCGIFKCKKLSLGSRITPMRFACILSMVPIMHDDAEPVIKLFLDDECVFHKVWSMAKHSIVNTWTLEYSNLRKQACVPEIPPGYMLLSMPMHAAAADPVIELFLHDECVLRKVWSMLADLHIVDELTVDYLPKNAHTTDPLSVCVASWVMTNAFLHGLKLVWPLYSWFIVWEVFRHEKISLHSHSAADQLPLFGHANIGCSVDHVIVPLLIDDKSDLRQVWSMSYLGIVNAWSVESSNARKRAWVPTLRPFYILFLCADACCRRLLLL